MNKKSANFSKQIIITTGDEDGIGLEISLKALLKIKADPRTVYYLYKTKNTPSFLKKSFSQVIKKFNSKNLIVVAPSSSPSTWVKEAGYRCLNEKNTALVTAPISKTLTYGAGAKHIGHTEILKDLTGIDDLFMAFLGKKFNVVLVTGHIGISKIHQMLTLQKINASLSASKAFLTLMSHSKSQKPLALLGLNPHSGENGLIGNEENDLFPKVFKFAKKAQINLIGPLVPDVAFQQSNWKKYSIYICPYHDQGLIPFKMIHKNTDSIHVTLGLPFIRTSVDHGTAKDIYGKNVANANSMLAAIRCANSLLQINSK